MTASVAMLFPGQGADLAAVAGAWHDASPIVRRLVAVAADECGLTPERLMHGAGLALRETRAYQPTLVAVGVGAWRELHARGCEGGFVAGHSLGELSACVAAGALADDAAVAVAALRGRVMAREAAAHPGGMLALRTDGAGAEEACALASRVSPVVIAARNAPDEYVLSGARAALRTVPARFDPTPLPTEGAWHSHAMEGAVEEYRSALRVACGALGAVRWLANRTGSVTPRGADPVPLLAEQLTRPVEWHLTMRALGSLGVRTLVTIGPARALRGLARRTLGDAITVLSIEHPDDLNRAEEALAA